MNHLNDTELYNVTGGAVKITAALLNSISRIISTALDVGRTIGTSIRMIVSKRSC